jgi:CheY-like chemotaxis protein
MKPIELLVVDNNISDIVLTRQALSEEPYPANIRVASDGHRAYQMVAEGHIQPDLVILDLNLPKMSGLAVLESIDPHVPVVVFTSSASSIDRRVACEIGAVDYIEKPPHPTEFIEAVSRIVKQWVAVPVGLTEIPMSARTRGLS